ncbi:MULTISPECIES: hypothetical protein [unclassified Caballeronia]|uniref:hypothetical protein n=1 Tax=unclassified Caballeronia TaxID=2646786 RepID=UPI0028641D38|nr:MULTISPECIES: hypothetical protein [unclassified Caballeronia]MDR5736598.1 hypothetical protein [Caballeronia sp. LZ016]MDR5810922.1 hypothetical protein [Caballeronia sp. LZ019]
MSDKHDGKRHLALIDEAWRYREAASRQANDESTSRWECMRGHRWDESLDHAQNIRCMSCAGHRRESETNRARALADVRGGKLVSPYVNAMTPLTWQCAYGHVWEAHADVAQRRWCGECARTVFARYR